MKTDFCNRIFDFIDSQGNNQNTKNLNNKTIFFVFNFLNIKIAIKTLEGCDQL